MDEEEDTRERKVLQLCLTQKDIAKLEVHQEYEER